MRLALEQPISFLGTPNPSTILRLVESADRAKDEIIRDIRDGTIAAGCNLTSSIRQALESRLKKNPGRAAELERMVQPLRRAAPHGLLAGAAHDRLLERRQRRRAFE